MLYVNIYLKFVKTNKYVFKKLTEFDCKKVVVLLYLL